MVYRHRTKSGKIRHYQSKGHFQRSLKGFFASQNGDKTKIQKKISKAKTKTQRKAKPKIKTVSKKRKEFVYISPFRPLGAWVRGDVGRDNLIEIDEHKLVTNKKLSVDTMKKLEIHPENSDDYGKLTYEQLIKETDLERHFGLKELPTYSNEDLDKYLLKDILSQVKGTDLGVIYSQDDIEKVVNKQIETEKEKRPKKMQHKELSNEEHEWKAALERHLNQSQEIQEKDLMEQAGTVYKQPTKDWMFNPKRSDIKDIDTKTSAVFGRTDHLRAQLGHLQRKEQEPSKKEKLKRKRALKGKVHKKMQRTDRMIHGTSLNPFGKLLVEEKEAAKRIDEIDRKLKQKFTKGELFSKFGGLSGWEARKKEFTKEKVILRREKKKLVKRIDQIKIDKKIELEKL